MQLLLIFLGAGLGGVFRYLVANGVHIVFPRTFPMGTLIVNISGSILMGFLFVFIFERFNGMGATLRAFFLIGILGGYTTFSSFSIETVNLIESGQWIFALLNIFASLIFCVGGAWLGLYLGRHL